MITRIALVLTLVLIVTTAAGLAIAAPPPSVPTSRPTGTATPPPAVVAAPPLGQEVLRPILSPQARREAARQLIDRFVAHVSTAPGVAESARQMLSEAWKKHRSDDQPEDFLLAGLAIINEPFKVGLSHLNDEQYAQAGQAMRPLVDAKDPYLSLNARALLARSLVEQEKLEDAETVLTPLAAEEKALMDKTFMETEVDFLLGYCQLSNLHYEQALVTLEQFERQHPGAPDRFLLPAKQMLAELQARQPEHLGDVADLMAYAGRGLATGRAGKPVQLKQEQAVALLGKLIEEAQEREKQGKTCKNCGGKGCEKCRKGKAGGNMTPSSPANRTMLPEGPGRIGDLHSSPSARPGDVWGQMRPEERLRILQSLRQNFPPRYRQLVEQYYKQLAKEP